MASDGISVQMSSLTLSSSSSTCILRPSALTTRAPMATSNSRREVGSIHMWSPCEENTCTIRDSDHITRWTGSPSYESEGRPCLLMIGNAARALVKEGPAYWCLVMLQENYWRKALLIDVWQCCKRISEGRPCLLMFGNAARALVKEGHAYWCLVMLQEN